MPIIRATLALAATLFALPACASVLFTFTQVGPDVVLTGVGRVEIPLFGFDGSGPVATPGLDPDPAFVLIGGSPGPVDRYYSTVRGPAAFGTGPTVAASSGSGPLFGFVVGSNIIVPAGYTGESFSATSVFSGYTIASLGLTPGTYEFRYTEFRLITDVFTVQVGPVTNETPEPGSVALLGLGLLASRAFGRRVRGGG